MRSERKKKNRVVASAGDGEVEGAKSSDLQDARF